MFELDYVRILVAGKGLLCARAVVLYPGIGRLDSS